MFRFKFNLIIHLKYKYVSCRFILELNEKLSSLFKGVHCSRECIAPNCLGITVPDLEPIFLVTPGKYFRADIVQDFLDLKF